MNFRQAKKIYLYPENHQKSSILKAGRIWRKRYPTAIKIGDHVVDIGCGCNHTVVTVGNKYIGMIKPPDSRFPDEEPDAYVWNVSRRYFHKDYQVLNQGDECQYCKAQGQDHWAGKI